MYKQIVKHQLFTFSILVENKWCFILYFQVFGNGLDQIFSAQPIHDHKAMFWVP
jgi:hypothetical protein